MKSARNPFIINAGFLINQTIGYSRVMPFEIDAFDFGDGLAIHTLNGTIELVRNQDGFRSMVDFEGLIGSECGRCLDHFQEKIHAEFEEFFTFPFVETSDDEIPVPENGNVDFEPILHDYLLMEMPINPICRPDCKGLCDICGANRNTTDCGHVHSHAQELQDYQLELEKLKKTLKT